MSPIKIFTDGSCHTQLKIGAWVALIFVEDKKIILQKVMENTTHNRMELSAVISAVHYVTENNFVYSGIETSCITVTRLVKMILTQTPLFIAFS